CRQHNSHPLTF
nr:immunoglobulin light chain junction region [Macaca mulatta]